MAQQGKPKDEGQVFHGTPVESVESSSQITAAKMQETQPGQQPGQPVSGQLAGVQPGGSSAAEEAAKRAVIESQEEFRTRELARRQNLSEQTKVGGDVNFDAARAEGERRAQIERDKRMMKRAPGLYVRSQVKLMNDAGVPMECPEGMRIPDEMVSKIPDVQALCDAGVLDDLR